MCVLTVRLEDDPNDPNGFVIKTISGKDFNINASKEKEDWMVQISAVRRCFLMRQRAEYHIRMKNYKAVQSFLPPSRSRRSN